METVDSLLAKEAIRAAALRGCQGIDRCDGELTKTAYHPDATCDYGQFKGIAWEFCDMAAKSLRRYKATKHIVTNHSIDLGDDGVSATGEIYVLASHLRADEAAGTGETIDVWWGRYVDRYESRDGDWRIVHRIVVHEWTMQMPIENAMAINAAAFTQGSFDRSS